MEGAGENSQNQAATVTAPASGGHAEVIQTEEKNPRKLLARELSSMDPENIVILQTGVLHPESVVRYLTVFVISAEGIPESDKKNPSYTVEVALGEKKQETNPSKDLTWNEVFRFPVPWETTENFLTTRSRDKVRFTLKEKTHVFTRIVGTLDKDLEDLLPEVMTELSEGIFYTDKKGRPASDTPSQTAKISFRMVLESLPLEDRHLAAKPLTLPKDLVVVYPTIDGIAFKPGDVLLYNMPGPVASLIKAKYGTIWSHCGLVVELPNKWTGEHQLYVLEYTRNVEGFFDRYSEEFLRCGPMLYRLEERIYGAPGTEIWLMPLKDSIVKPDSNAKLASWVTDLRSTFIKKFIQQKTSGNVVKDYDSDQVHWTFTEEEYLKSLKINVQNTLSYCEVFSANLCKVGLTRNFDIEFDGFCSVQDLTKSSKGKEFFESPYLLRCRPDFRFNISWPLPSGSAGPRRDKRNQGAEKALRGMESDFSYALKGSKTLRLHVREPEKALCAKQGIPGQKEALGQIQLINYFVFAEEQAVVVLDGIICTKSQDVISRADDIKRHFERLKRKFLALLDIIIEDCSTLSLDQLKEADALVAAHNKEWAALEAFVAEVAKTNPQLNASAMTQDKAQKDGEVYMNIISYLIKYEEEAIGCLERAEQLIPEPLIAQYIQIKETFFGLHRNFSRIRDEMLESHVVIDEKRALEAQRLSEDHKIAWISFERFTLEVAKCMV